MSSAGTRFAVSWLLTHLRGDLRAWQPFDRNNLGLAIRGDAFVKKSIRQVAYEGKQVPRYGRCLAPVEHDEEAWNLSGAVSLGDAYAAAAGMMPEAVDGVLVGWWKVMRCGCACVCLIGRDL